MFHALVKDAAEAVMQMLYQHTSFEEEVYSNTDQLMDMEHDIRFAQELIPFTMHMKRHSSCCSTVPGDPHIRISPSRSLLTWSTEYENHLCDGEGR